MENPSKKERNAKVMKHNSNPVLMHSPSKQAHSYSKLEMNYILEI